MTPTIAEVAGARKKTRGRTRPTVLGAMLSDLRELAAETTGIRFPCAKYENDPVGLAHDILGATPWERQVEILEAIRDHDRVSVVSGHKIGKSNTAAMVAFWFFCTRNDARVVLSSVTARQVDAILWREIRKMRARAGRCATCKAIEAERTAEDRRRSPAPFPCPHSSWIPGKMSDLARSGFRASDMREIVGFTAREAEAVAGVSGENIIYIVDEASGVEDAIFEAIEGNRAGDAKILLFSNGTRTEGEFFHSHHDKKLRIDAKGNRTGFYVTLAISSEESPNVRAGKKVIPGLATKKWIDEKKLEWGEDSALYTVRVKGGFALNEEGKILSLHLLTLAEQRWEDTPAEGRLFIGLDPAGPGDAGDDSVWAARRGLKVLELHVPTQGLSEEQHVTFTLNVIKAHRKRRELPPVVVIDREGPIGSRIYGLLRAYADQHPEAFVVLGVRSSDKAPREPHLYDRLRDELWANARAWFRDGGAIPEHGRLTKELHAPAWFQPIGSAKLKVTSKKDLRKLLDGRSPDCADALVLSTWESISVRSESARDDDGSNPPSSGGGGGFDPYAGVGMGAR